MRLRIVSGVGEQVFAFVGFEMIDCASYGIHKSGMVRAATFLRKALSLAKAISIVDEDQTAWIEIELPFEPFFPRRQNVRTLLRGGVRRLFCM